MSKRKGRTGFALIPLRALAIIARGMYSTYRAWIRPPRWEAHVGKLEPTGKEQVKAGPIFGDCCQHAHARYLIILPSSLTLHFCRHHYNKHKWALGAHGFEVRELPE